MTVFGGMLACVGVPRAAVPVRVDDATQVAASRSDAAHGAKQRTAADRVDVCENRETATRSGDDARYHAQPSSVDVFKLEGRQMGRVWYIGV